MGCARPPPYTDAHMLRTLIVIALLVTLGVLAAGIVAMTRGGEFNRKYGNKLMQARVAMQGLAIALLLLLYLVGRD